MSDIRRAGRTERNTTNTPRKTRASTATRKSSHCHHFFPFLLFLLLAPAPPTKAEASCSRATRPLPQSKALLLLASYCSHLREVLSPLDVVIIYVGKRCWSPHRTAPHTFSPGRASLYCVGCLASGILRGRLACRKFSPSLRDLETYLCFVRSGRMDDGGGFTCLLVVFIFVICVCVDAVLLVV